MPNSAGLVARLSLGTFFAALAMAFLAWGSVFDLGLFAWDTYPLIDAGRFSNADELGRSLSSELMGGRFPGGHYWRPLVHLSFGIDYALWGLDPLGYHVTDFAFTVLNATLVVVLARTLLGEPRKSWAWFAGLVFLLHPVHFEVLALPPRRADSMALAFTLLAIVLALRKPGQRSIGAALAALAAVASKETGALAPLLVFSFVALCSQGSRASRAIAGLRSAWIPLALVGLFLAARSAVVDGVGGGAKAGIPAGDDIAQAGLRYSELLLAPLPPSWIPDGEFAVVLGLVLFVILCVGLWRVQQGSVVESAAIPPRAAACALAAWGAVLVALTAGSGVYRAWYALPLAAPLAIFLALALSVRRLPGGGGSFRVFGATLILLALQGWVSDSQPRWDELGAQSVAADKFVLHFDEVVTSLEPGSTAELAAAPPPGSARRHGEDTKRPLIFREYSLEAYSALVHPGLMLRVEVKNEAQPQSPLPDEILVLLLSKQPEGLPR